MEADCRLLTSAAEIDAAAWDDFVARHPRGNIFHTRDYWRLTGSAPGSSAIVVCCAGSEGIRGILVAAVIRSLPWPFTVTGSRAVVWGGPLADGDDPFITGLLLDAFVRLSAPLVLYAQVRNLTPVTALHDTFLSHGFTFTPHLDIHIDLSHGAGEVWKGMHAVRRKQINRSKRRGVTVAEADATCSVTMSRCYSLLKALCRRERLPCPPESFFTRAAAILSPGGRLRLFTALSDSLIIGFRMVLCHGGMVYDWYAASDSGHLDKYPNDILPWAIMEVMAGEGYRLFGFGGAGRPGERYGVRDYKMRFGGQVVSCGRYTRPYRPLLYRLVMTAYRYRNRHGNTL